jgi:FkbM family methyltransferase
MPHTRDASASLHAIAGIEIPHIEIMDIGAMAEGAERYHPLVDHGLASVTGFEPNPAEFARLSGRPGPYAYHPVCLGDGGPATLHVTHYPGCSSLLRPDATVIDAFSGICASLPGGNFAVEKIVQVETVRLDDVEGCARPDLIKIDVQGAELLVLENGPSAVSAALVIECEAEFVPLYEDQPLFGDVHAFLRTHGFELHKLVDVSGRCYRPLTLENPFTAISQLLWADAVFVRSPFDLARYADGDLLKAAAILNDVYRSYDLVHRLLAEHDRRAGGSAAAAYAAFLNSGKAPPPLYMTQRQHR